MRMEKRSELELGPACRSARQRLATVQLFASVSLTVFAYSGAHFRVPSRTSNSSDKDDAHLYMFSQTRILEVHSSYHDVEGVRCCELL